MLKKNYILLAIIHLSLLSCEYRNQEDALPTPKEEKKVDEEAAKDEPCFSDLSYSNDVAPIFMANCVFPGCHNSSTRQANTDFSSITSAIEIARSGRLLKAIKHEAGVSPMPRGGAKLDDCSIAKIESWINNGFQNN